MKNFVFILLTFLFAVPSWAVPIEHPANGAARIPVFYPADFLVQMEPVAAESSHQHEQTGIAQALPEARDEHDHAATGESVATPEQQGTSGKGCKRGKEGCCCCKCCKDGDEPEPSGMQGCKMMKQGDMMMDGGKKDVARKPAVSRPATREEDGHEAHH